MNTKRFRYRQRDFHLKEIDNLTNINWNLEKYGCGPTSIANVLKNYGFDVNPIDMAKKILFDSDGNFDTTYLRNKGINDKGLIYCLERLIKEDKFNISYDIVKIDFSNPNSQKQKVIDLMKRGNMAMNTGLGLKMLMLTNGLHFSDGEATNFLLAVGLIADVIGIMALKYFTPKNDYLTITIKFGIRMALYWIAYISNDLNICLIAMTWSILISTAYENISDAPYINRIRNEYQMIFTNIRYTIGLVGTAIGLYFAGIMYNFGIAYNLGLSAFIMIFQIGIAYYCIYLRKKEKRIEVNNKTRGK